MRINNRELYDLLQRALSYQVLGTVEIAYIGPRAGIAIPYDDDAYGEFNGDDADKTILGLKFMRVIKQFIEDESNNIEIYEYCVGQPCIPIEDDDYTYIK